MQCYPIPVPSLNTAQQYAETAGSLAEALHELFLRRPCIRTDPANPGAQAAYYRAVGAWYMENNSIIAAALMACRLLSDGAALELLRALCDKLPDLRQVLVPGIQRVLQILYYPVIGHRKTSFPTE